MEFTIIITIIFLSILLIIYLITKKIIKTLIYFFVITTIISSVFAIVIFINFKDLQENIEQNPILLIVTDNNEPITIAQIYLSSREEPQEIPEQELIIIKNNLNNKNYDLLTEKYLKLVFIDLKTLEESPKSEIEIQTYTFQKEQILEALRSDNPEEKLNLNLKNTPNSIKLILFISTLRISFLI